MSVPEWTKDEQSIDTAKNYLRAGGTVDFFELMARNIIATHPPDLAAFSLEMVSKIIDGKELPADGEFHPKKLDDSRYMKEKNVSEFLDEWVLALLRERPMSDPAKMLFHRRYLEALGGGGASAVADEPTSNPPE